MDIYNEYLVRRVKRCWLRDEPVPLDVFVQCMKSGIDPDRLMDRFDEEAEEHELTDNDEDYNTPPNVKADADWIYTPEEDVYEDTDYIDRDIDVDSIPEALNPEQALQYVEAKFREETRHLYQNR